MTETFYQDLRFAARSLLRAPRFTVPAVLALALGIGATSAVFSVVRGVILEPLPYRQPDRIVSVWESSVARNRARNVIAPANFLAWRQRSRTLERLSVVGPTRLNILVNGQADEIAGLATSADVFAALGVDPEIGRTFTAEEDLEGSDGVIVLSHEFWQSRLGARTDVLGTTLRAGGRLRTVIGVMPPRFTIEGQKADFYVTYGWTLAALRDAAGRGTSHAIARLRDGVSLELAQEEMRGIMKDLEREAPRRNAGWSVSLVPVQELTTEAIRPALLILSGAVMLVLLIACVNVANLLLARSSVRQRELGLRAALGAARMRLMRQMVTESLVLGMIGGASGLLLAVAFHRGLLALVAERIPVPRLNQVTLNPPVIAFALLLALATGLLFGLAPAWVATSAADDGLRDGGRHGPAARTRRMLAFLVVVEVALSIVLLTGAALLIQSFLRLQNVDPGFRASGVLTARVSLPATRYADAQLISGFFSREMARVRQIPGVQSAAGISFLPLAGPGMATSFYRVDRPKPPDGEQLATEVRPVTPNFFNAMGIRQIAGRDFTDADRSGAPPVAVVSAELVRRVFDVGETALGRRLLVSIGSREGMNVEIVGMVGNVKFTALDGETRPAVYIPHPQLPVGLMTFVVRTALPPMALASSIAASVRDLDPELPLADVRTMNEVVDLTLARPRAVSVLLTAFALLAVVLAALGVYGVMSYSVSQRTREIGVRMALGATAASVLRLVMGQALRLIAIGVTVGLVTAALLGRLIRALLFDTPPIDAPTFAATSVILIVIAAAASYLPARRGTRIAPSEALRAE